MIDKNTQLESRITDNKDMVSSDFSEIEPLKEKLKDRGVEDQKKEALDPSKPTFFEGSRGRDLLQFHVDPIKIRDIQSDAELVGFWLHGKAKRTVEAYTLELKRFLDFLGGVGLSDMSVSHLMKYAESIKQNLSINSQALSLGAIKSLLSFGVEVGFLEKNLGVFLKLPKRLDGRVRKVIDEAKIQEMIFSERNLRNRLILRLLYSAGLRVSELSALKWGDIQARGECGQITVRGKGDKQRNILLSPGTWEELEAFRNAALASDPLFASQKGKGHLSRMQLSHIVKNAARRVGLSEKVSPHWIRHSHATHALERGASIILVKETLGHGSIVTTQKYLHSRPEESSSQYLGV